MSGGSLESYQFRNPAQSLPRSRVDMEKRAKLTGFDATATLLCFSKLGMRGYAVISNPRIRPRRRTNVKKSPR